MESIRPNLVCLKGGKTSDSQVFYGPITRLGLWHRHGQITRNQWMIIAGAKALLVASLMYLLFFR